MKNCIKLSLAIFASLYLLSCNLFNNDDEEPASCQVSIANSSITVTSNVSGEEGTLITPDDLVSSSIGVNSAEIFYKVLKVGNCHVVEDFGHVWSMESATPIIESANRSSYGSNVNFGDEVKTIMNDLIPNTKYFVRGYVTVRGLENDIVKTLYNDNISSFTTVRECDEEEIDILDDNDRILIVKKDNNVSILSFELFRERIAECDNGIFIANPIQRKYTFINNLISEKISCEYEIHYVQYNDDGTIFSEWTYNGVLNDLFPDDQVRIYLTDQFGTNFTFGETQIVLFNITYG